MWLCLCVSLSPSDDCDDNDDGNGGVGAGDGGLVWGTSVQSSPYTRTDHSGMVI